MKNSLCNDEQCSNFGKYWRNCGHKPKEEKTVYRIPKKSKSQIKKDRSFAKVKAEYLAENHFCIVCGNVATDVHHSKGKASVFLLLCKKYFKAMCRKHHQYYESHPAEAVLLNISSSRLTKL